MSAVQLNLRYLQLCSRLSVAEPVTCHRVRVRGGPEAARRRVSECGDAQPCATGRECGCGWGYREQDLAVPLLCWAKSVIGSLGTAAPPEPGSFTFGNPVGPCTGRSFSSYFVFQGQLQLLLLQLQLPLDHRTGRKAERQPTSALSAARPVEILLQPSLFPRPMRSQSQCC